MASASLFERAGFQNEAELNLYLLTYQILDLHREIQSSLVQFVELPSLGGAMGTSARQKIQVTTEMNGNATHKQTVPLTSLRKVRSETRPS